MGFEIKDKEIIDGVVVDRPRWREVKKWAIKRLFKVAIQIDPNIFLDGCRWMSSDKYERERKRREDQDDDHLRIRR